MIFTLHALLSVDPESTGICHTPDIMMHKGKSSGMK